jgi:hypothetical protein
MVSGSDRQSERSNSPLTIEQAKQLGRQFVKELEQEFSIKFIYWFVGSIATKEYLPGASDIDMVILPDESCDYGKIALRMVAKMEEYRKYGEVHKKGRYIPLIDPVIFFNTDAIHTLREEYHKRRKQEGGKANDRGKESDGTSKERTPKQE